MGVVKADAYGHGIVKVSETLVKSGVEYLAVASLEEALEVRMHFSVPILVLGYIPKSQVKEAVLNDITLTVYDLYFAQEVSEQSKLLNMQAKVHIKLDTGMNRIGFTRYQLDELYKLKYLSNLCIEGLYTHFSSADSDPEYTQWQYSVFNDIYNKVSNFIDIHIKHCCNSSAIINYPNMHMDMVRPGIFLYGLPYNNQVDIPNLQLKPAMSLIAKVIHLKNVASGSKIGYGGNFTVQRDSVIGTVSIGYGDGYTRKLSNNVCTLVNGRFAAVIGTICMDQCMIDLTDIPTKLYDEVVLFGKQGNNEISINDIANKLGTINYEIICSINKRVPRIYIT